MDYGAIVTDTFKLIWEEKKLWVISAIGLSCSAVLSMMYMGSVMGWQMNMMASLPMFTGAITENEMLDWFKRFLLGYVLMLSLFGALGLLSYIINLIARGALIAEANMAWNDESVELGRGFRQGLRKAAAFFLLDMLWILPWIVVFLLGLLFMGVVIGVFVGGIASMSGAESPGFFFSLIGSFFLIFGIMLCLGVIYGLFRGVFAPLMYQASAAGDKPLGDAIREGWELARNHLGPMIIVLLLLWAIQLGLSIIVRILSFPFTWMVMGPWLDMMNSLEQGALATNISPVHWGVLIIASVGMGFLFWLWYSLSQTISLTLYARVYHELRATPAQDPRPDAITTS